MLGIKDENIWITVSIIRRLRQVLWLILAGVAYFWYFNPQKAQIKNKKSLYGSFIH